MLKNGFEFSGPEKFCVKYNSPSRPISDLRTEFNHDALSIAKEHGPVYIGFSSGVDSQIIARCFLDMKLDAEFVFMHVKGFNDLEYEQAQQCSKFFNITLRVIEVNLEEHKADWIADNAKNHVNAIQQYPFEYLSLSLPENWPIVTQGKNEPCIVGSHGDNVSIYHNFYEAMELRFSLMRRHREVIDFPFSPEAITSYYTDEATQTFAATIKYHSKSLTDTSQYFNVFAKPLVKGKYFRDVIWYPKLTGVEQYPEWMTGSEYVKTTRVSVPYWELVDFLKSETHSEKVFDQWIYPNR